MLSEPQRASLAARLRHGRNETAPKKRSPFVPLNDGPPDRKLVLFHAIGGTVFAYGHLARELSTNFLVCGLPSPERDTQPPDGLPASRDPTEPSLASLVSHYVELLREFQPKGPYRLAGWSMGGILAYEVARVLLGEGDQVLGVGLLDSPFWLPDRLPADEAQFVGLFVRDAARSLGADAGSPPDPMTSDVTEQLTWLGQRLGADSAGPELAGRYAAFRANTRLLAGYHPSGPLDADCLIVDVADSANSSPLWIDVVHGRAELQSLPGNHYSFLQPPIVADVATAIRAVLAGVEPSGPPSRG